MADVNPSPDRGAAGTDYETARALASAGHEVESVWSDELSHRIGHYNLRYLVELPASYRNAMISHLRSGEFDVVQVSQPHGFLAAKAIAKRQLGSVFVHRSHGFEALVREVLKRWRRMYPEERAWYRRLASLLMERLLERNNALIARYADGHLVSATPCADYLHSVYGVEPHRIAVVAQAVPARFLEGARPVDPRRVKRLLYVGQYGFFKAPMVLGKVVSRLLKDCPNAQFTWVCEARHHVEAAGHFAPDVLNRVRFLDWMDQSTLLEIYDDHGVFLFPSFFEGFGKAFLEAMSRGLVVMASRTGGAEDVIEDGVDGVLTEVGSVADMVAAATGVMANLQHAVEMSNNAVRKARLFTWERYVVQCEDFYRDLIARKRDALRGGLPWYRWRPSARRA